MSSLKPYVVIPNWNGAKNLPDCLNSLLTQSLPTHIIVVDNGSTDASLDLLNSKYPEVEVLALKKNIGFAGGVNAGIKKGVAEGAEYVALLNNDAVAHKDWVRHLVKFLDENREAGIVTSKIVDQHNKHIDSTGDIYTIWGLPFPRGRGEPISDRYDNDTWVFGASGGASIYRVKMLDKIGLFDSYFFAYYEDVDISFRAQLAGWKVAYEPKAVVYHQIGATSSKIKGFATYQTLKNLPMVVRKNVPLRLLPTVLPRFWLAYSAFFWSAVARGQAGPAFRGWFVSLVRLPKNFIDRYSIQKNRRVSAGYINSIITHDLPPNAHKLRKLRNKWWRIRGKKSA
jgi:GT2 family glycosyltransferase